MDIKPKINSSQKPPVGFTSYIVSFKDGDIHPQDKVSMRGRAVRVFAPNLEKAMVCVKHRFGSAFAAVRTEFDCAGLVFINGLWETLIWKKL